MSEYLHFIPLAVSFAAAVGLVPLTINLAIKCGFLDQPNARKVHQHAIPRIGGLAILGGLVAGSLTALFLLRPSSTGLDALDHELIGLSIAALFVAIVGFVDDVRTVSSRYKLIALIFASVLITSTGASFGALLLQGQPIVEFRWLAWAATIIWICGITVAVNFIDGLDGLASGLVALAAGVLGLGLLASGEILLAGVSLSLFGALLGFLVYNRHPAKVFMGDCGSMLIGMTIASLMLMANHRIGSMRAMVLPSLALAIPILDGTLTFFRRHYLQRRSIFSAERGHIHHRLIDRGLRHNQAVWFIYVVSFTAVIIGAITLAFDNAFAKFAGMALVLPLLWGAFRFAGSVKTNEMLQALRAKRDLDRQSKSNRNSFEELQLVFDKAQSVASWWSCVCDAAEQFDFLKLKLEMKVGDETRNLVWEHPNLELLESSKIFAIIPIPDSPENGNNAQAEIDIAVTKSVELSGERLALFSRLTTEHSLQVIRRRERQVALNKILRPDHAHNYVAPATASGSSTPAGPFSHLKVAVVHDFLYTYAGAERVLEQIINVVPHCDVFALFDFLPESQRGFLKGKPVKTSFIQNLPFAKSKHRAYLPLMPLAVEQLDVSQYDLVISSSYVAAKGVITGPDQLHVCYCHSPVRYAWDLQHQYLKESKLGFGLKGLIARTILHYLRHCDVRSSLGVDHFIANSRFVARRIEKVYRREATVIYPPVDTTSFTLNEGPRQDYYVVAGRMVPYKRTELIVQAFNAMPNRELVVVGEGPDFEKIKAIAGPNIKLMGYQDQAKLIETIRKAKALVFAAEEDFGIVPVEALSCGTPVIAYKKGGVTESVIDGSCGVFFDHQTTESIIASVDKFDCLSSRNQFRPYELRDRSQQYDSVSFRERLTKKLKNWVEGRFSLPASQSTRSSQTQPDLASLAMDKQAQ